MAEKNLAVSELAAILATKHKLGSREEITRQLRYFTADLLLETVGSVHTGSGRKRLYPPSAVIKAVVLLRLFQSGASVGIMQRYITALEKYTLAAHGTKDLLKICKIFTRPTICITLPDQRHNLTKVRIDDWEDVLKSISPDVDFIAIQVRRFL